MSATGFVVLAIAVWVTFASVRTIQRIGLRQFSVVVARRGWVVSKVLLRGTWFVVGAMFAAASRSDDDGDARALMGPDLMDITDPANFHSRAASPLYTGDDLDRKEGGF